LGAQNNAPNPQVYKTNFERVDVLLKKEMWADVRAHTPETQNFASLLWHRNAKGSKKDKKAKKAKFQAFFALFALFAFFASASAFTKNLDSENVCPDIRAVGVSLSRPPQDF
jgi:hypothetical protein